MDIKLNWRASQPSSLHAIVLILLVLLVQSTALAQQTKEAEIVAADATVREIFSGGETQLEGPAMSPDGMLYFCDLPLTNGVPGKAGIIWMLNPLTGESSVFRSPSGMANGLTFDAEGNLIACEGADFGGRRVTKTDMKTGKSIIIAGLFQGRSFNAPNDVAVDEQGRVYFTDPRYIGHEPLEQHVMGVYRIDYDGSVHLVAANVAKPNGIAISPDQKTVYVTNCDQPGDGNSRFLPDDLKAVRPTGEGSILAYSLKPDGSLQLRGKFIDYGTNCPDGLAIDREGNLYIGVWERLEVYSPQGKKIAKIKVPEAVNMCFGRGRFSKTLFIAGGKSIYAIDIKKEGYHLPFKK